MEKLKERKREMESYKLLHIICLEMRFERRRRKTKQDYIYIYIKKIYNVDFKNSSFTYSIRVCVCV